MIPVISNEGKNNEKTHKTDWLRLFRRVLIHKMLIEKPTLSMDSSIIHRSIFVEAFHLIIYSNSQQQAAQWMMINNLLLSIKSTKDSSTPHPHDNAKTSYVWIKECREVWHQLGIPGKRLRKKRRACYSLRL